MPTHLEAQHTQSLHGIVERHALDNTGKHVLRCLLGLCGAVASQQLDDRRY